jgi:DNA-binding PadR family transcriptional regulator
VQAELLKGHLEGLVLAVLADGPLHGYAVMENLRTASGDAIAIEGGTLYPLLHRIEEAGLVKSSWSTIKGRKRRTYSLTAKGTRALKERRHAWGDFVTALGAVMERSPKGAR